MVQNKPDTKAKVKENIAQVFDPPLNTNIYLYLFCFILNLNFQLDHPNVRKVIKGLLPKYNSLKVCQHKFKNISRLRNLNDIPSLCAIKPLLAVELYSLYRYEYPLAY